MTPALLISLPAISAEAFYYIAPILLFSVLGFVSMMWGAVAPLAAARGSVWLGVLGSLITLGLSYQMWGELGGRGELLFSNMVIADRFGLFFIALTAIITTFVLLITRDYLEREEIAIGEAYSLIFFGVVGIIGMIMSNDLMLLFICLELMSLAVYILTGFNRGNYTAIEGSLKYFILGSFASAFMLLGIALIYGALGTTSMAAIGKVIGSTQGLEGVVAHLTDPRLTPGGLGLGMGLVLLGFAFKIGSVPFHMWVPDVYQGAIAPVTAFMATGVKGAAFASLIRFLVEAMPGLRDVWAPIITVLVVLTLVVGNIAALVQKDIKRMLAYSSIAHGGYAMMGLLAAQGGRSNEAVSSILLYMLVYALMNVGAFAVVVMLHRKGQAEVTSLESYSGLGFKYPFVSAALSLFLISLAGLPPTAGFVAKFNLFSAVVAAGYTWLVVIALITSAISVYYYLRVVVQLYMKSEEVEVTRYNTLLPSFVVVLTVMAILVIGVMPSAPFSFIQWARDSVVSLM